LNTSCLVKFIYIKKGLGLEVGDQHSVVLVIL
jgi:hypothetical protein